MAEEISKAELEAGIGRQLLESDPDAVMVLDPDYRIVRSNPAAEVLFGYAESELIGLPLDGLLPPDVVEAHEGYMRQFAQSGGGVRHMGQRRRVRGRHRDGTEIPAEATIGISWQGDQPYFFAILRDVSEQVAYEQALEQERDLTSALSKVLGLLTRPEPANPATVYEETCRMVVQTGGLALAWIGEPDTEGWLRPVAVQGEAAACAAELPVAVSANSKWGQGPSGTAYSTGRTNYVQDTDASPAMAPWQQKLAAYGLRASAAFPLYREGQVQGTLNVYAQTPGFFTERLANLLERITHAVTAALERFHHEAERHRLTQIVEAAPDLIGLADPEGQILYNNPAARTFLGAKGQNPEANIRDFHPDWAARLVAEEGLPSAQRTGSWEGETAFLDAQGREKPFSQIVLAHSGPDGAVAYYATIAREITGQKAREAALNEQFHKAVETLVNFVEFFDPDLLEHHRHVADWAQRVGTSLGYHSETQEQLYFAALLHDIGFLGLPPRVRSKSFSLLTSLERGEWKRHPELGEAALIGMDRMDGPAHIIRHHHERWDGHGIPDGLVGEDIPWGSRILAIVSDYFDLLEGRFYVNAVESTVAASFLREGSGSRYDPAIVQVFLEQLGEEAPNTQEGQKTQGMAAEPPPSGVAPEAEPAPNRRPDTSQAERSKRTSEARHAEGSQDGSGRHKNWRSRHRKPQEAEQAGGQAIDPAQEWRLNRLEPGMILVQELRTQEGVLLLSSGTVLDERLTKKLNRLQNQLPLTVQARWPEPDEGG